MYMRRPSQELGNSRLELNCWTSKSMPSFQHKNKTPAIFPWTKISLQIFVCMCVCVYLCAQLLSHVKLCNPINCSPPGSSVHEIFQARILEWVAISSSRGSSQQGSNLCLLHLLYWQQMLYHCFPFESVVDFKRQHIWQIEGIHGPSPSPTLTFAVTFAMCLPFQEWGP